MRFQSPRRLRELKSKAVLGVWSHCWPVRVGGWLLYTRLQPCGHRGGELLGWGRGGGGSAKPHLAESVAFWGPCPVVGAGGGGGGVGKAPLS